MGKFSISAGKNGILMTKHLRKVRPVFFVFKFWQEKLSDFSFSREETTVIYYLLVFLFVLVEFQSSFQDLNIIGVFLSRRNLALFTRDPFQPLKSLFRTQSNSYAKSR